MHKFLYSRCYKQPLIHFQQHYQHSLLKYMDLVRMSYWTLKYLVHMQLKHSLLLQVVTISQNPRYYPEMAC